MATENEWCPPGWDRQSYPHGDHSHAYYVVDRSAPSAPRPSVMLMHEFPGIKENLVKLADLLADEFRIFVPSLFGRDGIPSSLVAVRQLCVRREVHILARDGVSRSAEWLRAFANDRIAGSSGRPFGVIGLCFTGNFALALAVDRRVAAAVVGEPAIPLRPSGLGLSERDRDLLKKNVDLRVQGYRFRRDCISPAAKLAAAKELLDDRMRIFTLSSPGEMGHSTLTGDDASPAAIANVRAFLRDRLVA
jgi:dienelactone hydrolase